MCNFLGRKGTTDIKELCKINWKQGKLLQQCKILPKAQEWFEYIIKEVEKDIRPVGIEKYAIKAYQQKAIMHFDILCFKTAFELLGRAEEIIREVYGLE